MKKIKIIDLLNMISKGEEVPKKIKYLYYEYEFNEEEKEYQRLQNEIIYGLGEDRRLDIVLDDEVEIIEEKKKFTKEDFINERMGIDKITRKEFDEMYEVKECNCGMPYCKGFIAVDKEEPQEHKIPEKIKMRVDSVGDINNKIENLNLNQMIIEDKINEILDYLGEIE